jgi:hypothetical protein
VRVEREVPEGLVRDSRRGSWIMVVPPSEFVRDTDREPKPQPKAPVVGAFYGSGFDDNPEPRVFSSEIGVVFALAIVLSYMFWTFSHV